MQGSPDGAEADAWVVTLRLRPCADAGEREVEVRLGVETLPARGAERWRVTDVAVVR
jgi:hypothetical protein